MLRVRVFCIPANAGAGFLHTHRHGCGFLRGLRNPTRTPTPYTRGKNPRGLPIPVPITNSTITFAVSDPDGKITSALLNDRATLFGKETTVRKWIDKPALIQCSHCHTLGHNKASKACPLGKDSVKCFICGGAHRSDKHDQLCGRKHAVAGICDCKHFKCLSCQKLGHNCRDTRCPARDLYRPRGGRRAGNRSGKGKERDTVRTAEQPPDSNGDLYTPLPPVAGPSRPPPASPTSGKDPSA
jgi:hypothetical protein